MSDKRSDLTPALFGDEQTTGNLNKNVGQKCPTHIQEQLNETNTSPPTHRNGITHLRARQKPRPNPEKHSPRTTPHHAQPKRLVRRRKHRRRRPHPEQASWTDGKENHSVGQLANHLIFWNFQELAKFKGETPAKFSGNNDETFNSFDSKNWPATVKQLDQVLTDWEKAVEAADEGKLKDWYSKIAHVGTHNAYHIGQMIYVRKEQGSWNPEKGVK